VTGMQEFSLRTVRIDPWRRMRRPRRWRRLGRYAPLIVAFAAIVVVALLALALSFYLGRLGF